MAGGEEPGKYGDFDPTAFRIEQEAAIPAEVDTPLGPEVAADHEIEVNPEKLPEADSVSERTVRPAEYLAALERVLAGPERGALVDKARGIMRKLEKLDPEQRAIIIEVLGDTLLELKKASKGLKDYYESVGLLLNQIENGLDKN